MSDAVPYSVRDPYGNVYGPASGELLRQWVGEGRIIPGMAIGEMSGGALAWREASTHPVIADLFQRGQNLPSGSQALPAAAYPAPGSAPVDYGINPRPSRMPGVSLVLGVLAFLFSVPSPLLCCCGGLSIPLGIAGAIVGLIAVFQVPPPQVAPPNKMAAWIGVGLSVLALLISVVGIGVAAFSQWNIFHAAGGGGGF